MQSVSSGSRVRGWHHFGWRRFTRNCASERARAALTEATSAEEIFSRRRAAARWRACSAFASSMFSVATAMSVTIDTRSPVTSTSPWPTARKRTCPFCAQSFRPAPIASSAGHGEEECPLLGRSDWPPMPRQLLPLGRRKQVSGWPKDPQTKQKAARPICCAVWRRFPSAEKLELVRVFGSTYRSLPYSRATPLLVIPPRARLPFAHGA